GVIYVDKGIPYDDGELSSAELTKLVRTSVLNMPQGADGFAVVYYVGGLNTLVIAQLYTILFLKLASHGLFVFGIDYYFPANTGQFEQDIDMYFKEFDFEAMLMCS
ncbi:hypothetical protein DPMN_169773, partial [Dreissena polymorpha]